MIKSTGLLLSALVYTICFQKLTHGLDHLSTYQLIQDFVDGDKWIHVLMMRSSGRLTQL